MTLRSGACAEKSYGEIVIERDMALSQRDELLAALKELLALRSGNPDVQRAIAKFGPDEPCEAARAAIARALILKVEKRS